MFREAISLLVRDIKAIWHDCVLLKREIRKAKRMDTPFAQWEIDLLRQMPNRVRVYSKHNSQRMPNQVRTCSHCVYRR